jgi:pimeloyl-ACP methyl ester carboxylesterase
VWRHLLDSTRSLAEKATLVVVDLPGYGGSDGCNTYSPDEVLEALTEFVVAMRDLYVEQEYYENLDGPTQKLAHARPQVYVVGHDWGSILGFRLAAEAPALADRFILTNGPLVSLNDPLPFIWTVIMLYDTVVLTGLGVGAPSYGQQRQYPGLLKADLQNISPGSHGATLLPPEVV